MNYNPNLVVWIMELITPTVRAFAGIICFFLFAASASGIMALITFCACLLIMLVLKEASP